MAKAKNQKYSFEGANAEKEYNEQLKDTNVAGGGMVVPANLQTDGLELAVECTGVQELRPTKKSTEDVPVHYGATQVTTEDGLSFYILNTTFYPKGTKLNVKVTESINPDTKKPQFGFTLMGQSQLKGATATA